MTRLDRRGWLGPLVSVVVAAAFGCSGDGDAVGGGGAGGDAGALEGGADGSSGGTSSGDPGQPYVCSGALGAPGPARTDTTALPAVTVPSDILPADRATPWNPGILADTELGLPLGGDGLPQRADVHKTVSPGANLQQEIDATPAGKVLLLAPGTFAIDQTLQMKSGVVVRGSGSEASCGTTIQLGGSGPVVAFGDTQDQVCVGNFGTFRTLAKDALAGSSTIELASGASDFAPGDLAFLDVKDTAEIDQGDCAYFKRASGRSATQRVEIASVSGNVVTLASPLHWSFTVAGQAQIAKVTAPAVRFAGLEHLRVAGGVKGYLGQYGAGVDMSGAAYSWVKDVQTGGSIDGMHVAMTGTYRSVVRDSYVHHSATYGYAEDCYGIVLRCGAAENLVENNIVRFMNKPILFNVSGGGNVIGYNYVDNSWAEGAWQETPIDCHCSFPHMELIEGNWAPKVGATTTHGNAGYLTFFRNYDSSQFAPPGIWQGASSLTGNVAAMLFPDSSVKMSAIGNVLGVSSAGTSPATTGETTGNAPLFSLGGASDVSQTTFLRHGNWLELPGGGKVAWDGALAGRTLPPSFYRSTKPPYFGSSAWPWAGPDLTPHVGTLPAKARSEAAFSPPAP